MWPITYLISWKMAATMLDTVDSDCLVVVATLLLIRSIDATLAPIHTPCTSIRCTAGVCVSAPRRQYVLGASTCSPHIVHLGCVRSNTRKSSRKTSLDVRIDQWTHNEIWNNKNKLFLNLTLPPLSNQHVQNQQLFKRGWWFLVQLYPKRKR